MNKQTGMIITIVLAVLTLCCSSGFCLFGGLVVAGQGEWSSDFGTTPQTGQMDPIVGVPIICVGILLWVLPVLAWFFLVRGKNGETVV